MAVTVEVVHVLAHRKHLYACAIPDTVRYTGEIVESPKWSPNSVCLTTGDPRFPVRMIDRARIKSIDGSSVPVIKRDDAARVFTVKGSKGNKYTVTVNGSQTHCDCAGFQYRKHCKHVSAVQNKLSNQKTV